MSLQLVSSSSARPIPTPGGPEGAPEAPRGLTRGGAGDVLVTRHQLANFGQNEFVGTQLEPFFVDWLSLYQSHPQELPIIDDGTVMGIDSSGELVWKTCRKARVEGSHETSVSIRCDGHTVHFEGNVSRFGRTNNVFGFDLAECLRRVNNILAKLGLPPFTWGRKFHRPKKTTFNGSMVNTGELEECWTGARITRIDMTANYGAGSLADARAYMEWLATQQHSSRVKVGTYADGCTVDWGKGSRRVYSKVYLKSAELLKHGGPAELVQYCEEAGLVRFEVTAKATQLMSMGCQYLGSLDMGKLIDLFEDRQSVMQRAEHTHDDLEHLPNAFRRTARDYLAGDNLAVRMGERTFRRHRAALLPYGLDIAVARKVINFQPKVRVIELRPLSAPSWYQFEERRTA